METFWAGAWASAFGTVMGGLMLSAAFFILKEYVFQRPQITRIWECQLITQRTCYSPFAGMSLWYRVTLVQNGDEIVGYAEKDRESATGGARSYSGADRCPVEILGSVEKNYLSPDRIYLSWVEQGAHRKSSSVFKLSVSESKNTGDLIGHYQSTIANSSGRASWCRCN